jgi:HAD superfamily hydrolase (TIGR01509 family)
MVHIAESLRKHYKTALVSNAPSEFIRRLLQAHDLARLFDEIVISSEVSTVKPSKEIFELILSKLKVAPSEAVFIDDNPGHVEAALKYGIKSIRFTSAQQLRKELEATDLKST